MKLFFEWDTRNTAKLDQVRQSGRLFTIDEIESVFDDPYVLTLPTYADPVSNEYHAQTT